MLRWFPAGELRPVLAWCACLLSHGTLISMRLAVPDGPSVLLIALAIVAVEQQRSRLAAGLLGIATLGRETNLLASVVLTPTENRNPDLAGRLIRACLLLVPFCAWTAYLLLRDLPGVVSTGTQKLRAALRRIH